MVAHRKKGATLCILNFCRMITIMKLKICVLCMLFGSLLGTTYANDVDEVHPTNATENSALTLQVKNGLAAENDTAMRGVVVKTNNGGAVVLSGTAPNQAAIDKAQAIASHIIGVNSVTNQIMVKTGH